MIKRCEGCHKLKLGVKKRAIQTPIGQVVSQKKLCRRCGKVVEKAVKLIK